VNAILAGIKFKKWQGYNRSDLVLEKLLNEIREISGLGA